MTTPTPPEAYPFMRIARLYGAAYGDVLLVADRLGDRHTQRGEATPHHRAASERICAHAWSDEILVDIEEAVQEQDAIRRGDIDWRTGERRV